MKRRPVQVSLTSGIMIAVCMLITAACDSIPTPVAILTPIALPTPIEAKAFGTNIKWNISKEQLEQAWAMWQAQAIAEYELTVEFQVDLDPPSGIWHKNVYQMRVNSERVTLISSDEGSIQLTPSADDRRGVLGIFTVEGRFSLLHGQLSTYDPALPTDVTCDVIFDDELGYPALIDCPAPPEGLREALLTLPVVHKVLITRLEVTQRATPHAP